VSVHRVTQLDYEQDLAFSKLEVHLSVLGMLMDLNLVSVMYDFNLYVP